MQKLVDPASAYLDATAAVAANPEAVTRNMLKLAEQSSLVMGQMMRRGADAAASQSASGGTEPTDLLKLWAAIGQSWASDPKKLTEMQADLTSRYMHLWQNTAQKMLGHAPEPVAKPEPGDNRFKDPDWTTNPYFDFWKQSYLLTAQWATKALDETAGLDERTKHYAEFALRQMLTALSPTNYPATNPEVIRETVKSHGANLVAGLENFAGDLAKSGDMLKISQTDTTAFEIGRNVATAKGKVVYQNELLQLIQYSPTTDKVHEVPFLIVPPWINKYYILDLTPEKSFIKYIVDQGFTVFVVSRGSTRTSRHAEEDRSSIT